MAGGRTESRPRALLDGFHLVLAVRLIVAGFPWADPIRLGHRPFYVYDWAGSHLSAMPRDAYDRLGSKPTEPASLTVGEPPGLELQHPRLAHGIHPRAF